MHILICLGRITRALDTNKKSVLLFLLLLLIRVSVFHPKIPKRYTWNFPTTSFFYNYLEYRAYFSW